MVAVEEENPRWYFFLSRELILKGLPFHKIKSILNKGLLLSTPNSEYELGLVVNYLRLFSEGNYTEANLRNANNLITRYQSKYPNCMDFTYYNLHFDFFDILSCLKFKVAKNITSLTQMEKTMSFLHSHGDHLFYLWFQIYLSMKEYDLAFSMLSKIKSCEIKKDVLKELEQLQEYIAHYAEKFMQEV